MVASEPPPRHRVARRPRRSAATPVSPLALKQVRVVAGAHPSQREHRINAIRHVLKTVRQWRNPRHHEASVHLAFIGIMARQGLRTAD
jgi:hypothetical protein